MAEHLYTTKEVAKVREELLKKQGGRDLITGMNIAKGDAVLDHCHDTQYVRGVLSRPSNVALGKIENLWMRVLKSLKKSLMILLKTRKKMVQQKT